MHDKKYMKTSVSLLQDFQFFVHTNKNYNKNSIK